MKYKKLFKRGKIGELSIKNRIVSMPVGAALATLEGDITEDFIAYYEERARGGAGLIITGVIVTDNETGVMEPNLAFLGNDLFIRGWKRFTDTIHKYDCKVFAQIYHPGKETNSASIGGRSPVSVSSTVTKFGEETHELTIEEIYVITQRLIAAANLARRADFDGVEVHCAHGYLLNDFITPYENRRTDEYGGSFENRMRLPAAVIRGIRAVCGPEFPISVRISADEFVEGGIGLSEGEEIARYFEGLGVDAIDVSAGIQKTSHLNREPPSYPQGWKKHLAASVKKEVSIPVIAVNTIKKPDFAESLLDEGVCDFVGLARGHLADPRWAEKARAGKDCEIRTCISCLVCFETLIQRKRMTCSVNPALHREREFSSLEKNGGGRKIAVIGGGPGGMQAAYILALRGFDVTIYEKSGELGGQLKLAEAPPDKEKISWLKNSMIAQLYSAGVKVMLNADSTPQYIKALSPDGVFMCCGSEPVVPSSLPGINGETVYTVPQVLSGSAVLDGHRVAIIGSGLSGLETAIFLASRGCRIDIVELLDEIGKGIYGQVRDDVLKKLSGYRADTGFYPAHRLSRIYDTGISLNAPSGGEIRLEADTVVLSMGVKPLSQLVEGFVREFDRLILVGDAARPGRIADTIRDGYTKAWVF